jgi:hypothetical protein
MLSCAIELSSVRVVIVPHPSHPRSITIFFSASSPPLTHHQPSSTVVTPSLFQFRRH